MAYFPVSDWQPPEDPIFGLTAAFRKDSNPHKVNLGVGAYRTATGEPYLLPSVRTAEHLLWEKKLNKEYLPIDGDSEFCRLGTELVFGPLSSDSRSRIYTAQMTGGTGALRMGGEYLAMAGPRTVYVSVPTWPNHKGVFEHAGCTVETYPYYDSANSGIDFLAMCESINRMPAGSAIVLHSCCHNPTGIDLTFDQWRELSDLLKKRRVIPFFDEAYQGLGDGLDADAHAVRYFMEQGHEFLLAYSCSKNFGLYSERVGLLLAVTESASTADLIGRQVKTIIRANYSNPSSHGARIVSTILHSDDLRKEWQQELEGMRQRILEMRLALVNGVRAKGLLADFDSLMKQRGLFCYGLLNKQQVERLRSDFGIYLPLDGRINVAGLNPRNLPYVVDAIGAVCR